MGVRGPEADSVNIQCQAVGILSDLDDGLFAVGLVYPYRPPCSDSVGLEKDHDLPDELLLGLGGGDLLHPFPADAREIQEPFWLGFGDGENILPECLDKHLGEMGADPLDHAGTKIFLDPFEGAGGDRLELVRLELESVNAVVLPCPDAFDVFAGGDGCCGADDGDQVPPSLDLGAEYTETGFLAVEGDPFKRAG